MARILGIDYGTKKIGIAVTDPLQIIASPLDTVPTLSIFEFLENYLSQEDVEAMVVGEPMHIDGNPTAIEPQIIGFIRKIQKKYPDLNIYRQDERYSTVDAKQAILDSGAKKKKRRDKNLVDRVSAALILQAFMETNRNSQ